MANGMRKNSELQVASSKWEQVSLLFAVFSLLLPVCGFAEELTDPTRPPASIFAPVAQAGVEVAEKSAILQSILISKNRRAAIIDGQTVELGGRIRDAKLIEVNSAYVVLKTNKGRQVLGLFPDVKISRADVSPVTTQKKVRSGEKK